MTGKIFPGVGDTIYVVPSTFYDLDSSKLEELEIAAESIHDIESAETVLKSDEEGGWVLTGFNTYDEGEWFMSPEEARANARKLIETAKKESSKRSQLLDELMDLVNSSNKRNEE